MEQLTANLSGAVRRAKLQGRDYLVAPLTLIVPGVLNGSQGPLLYPPEEVSKNPGVWNGVPIVVDHPTHGGQPVSARDPDVLNKQQIGQIFRSKANGKLVAEGWFDLQAVERIDNRVLQLLEAGKEIELSTGLFTDNEPADKGAVTEDGKPYSFIARNYRPDHLAILPDQIGACSVDDGCGVNVNKQSSSNKGESDMATKLSDESRKKIVDDLIANSCCWNEADREVLNGLDDGKLGQLKAQAEKDQQREAVVNAAKKGFTDPSGNTHTYNEEKREYEFKAKELEPVVNKEDDKPPTEEEWLAGAPVGVREDLEFARNEKSKQKSEVIDRLIVNISDEGKQNQRERLEVRSLEDLRSDLTLLPEKQRETIPTANYMGAAASTGVVNKGEKDFAPFGLPTEYIEENVEA